MRHIDEVEELASLFQIGHVNGLAVCLWPAFFFSPTELIHRYEVSERNMKYTLKIISSQYQNQNMIIQIESFSSEMRIILNAVISRQSLLPVAPKFHIFAP